MSRTLAGATLLCLPAGLFSKLEAKADEEGNDVVLRFSALSDVHFKVSPEAKEVDRFRRSMAFMYEYSAKQKYPNFDAMLVAGDFSDHGYEEELTLFRKIMDEGIKEGTETILCMGNHEYIAGSRERWERIFERDGNKVYKVKGFSFVALSPERGTCRDGDYLYALDWFKNEVDKAAKEDPDKPIFTFQHYHITPTVYGSRGEDNWGIRDLYETLQEYPRVIDFSGHSHYPITDPRSAWQGNFTAFGTGTLSYFEMGGEGGKYSKFPEGYGNAAQMYVVEVRKDNSVVLKPYDLITNTFFDVVYYVQPGKIDSYLYTDERATKNARPEWADDAKLVADVDEETGEVRISFPQATCKDVVHSYRVEATPLKADGSEDDEFEVNPQYFWSEYYFKNQPKTMNVLLGNLPDNANVRVKVVALNPWFTESEKALVVEFKTPKNPIVPADPDAEFPEPNMLDVAVVGGAIVNKAKNELKKQKEIQIDGAPKIGKVAGTNAEGIAFNGGADRLKIAFSSRDYAAMGKATIAAAFRFDAFPADKQDVLACTEGRGVSFELDGPNKKLELWASINGAYTTIAAPVEAGKLASAFGTYDGKTLKLYINGKVAASAEKAGRLTYPADKVVQAFCVGSDIAHGGSGSNYFKGSVVRAQVYSWALTEKQVQNLSK